MVNKKILFVCMGNICRSPAAETIMTSLIKKDNLENSLVVDSAGTIDYHTGESADPRMRKQAALRNYDIVHRARAFNPKTDFDKFDYIITMDNHNYEAISVWDQDKKYRDKIFKMTTFSSKYNIDEVPDPYYHGTEGFDYVLNILEDACSGLLSKVKNEIGQSNKGKD